MKTKKLYKFLREGLKSNSGNHSWKVSEWYHIEGKVDICNNGFHASKTIQQAFSYVQGEILAEVEVRGNSVIENDKECWSEMRLVKAWHWTKKDSVALSIFASELVLDNYEKMYPGDTRPRDAIEAAKKVLADDTEDNRSAARSAESAARSAESAARSAESAARSAESAAESAARSARSARSAESAARSAARSAAWSAAESAAESALIKKITKWFDERLLVLTEYK